MKFRTTNRFILNQINRSRFLCVTRFQTKKRFRTKRTEIRAAQRSFSHSGCGAPLCSRPIFRAARMRKLLRAARTSFALCGNACYAGYKLILSLTLHQNTYQAFPCDNQSSKIHTALDWLRWDKGLLLKSIQKNIISSLRSKRSRTKRTELWAAQRSFSHSDRAKN